MREVFPDLSEELIARELGLRTSKTLYRLSVGEGTNYETTVKLLAAAGWLTLDGDGSNVRAGESRLLQEAQRLREMAAALEAALRETPEAS